MKFIAVIAIVLLTSCAGANAPPQTPAQMSDAALCFALAEDTPPPGIKAEMQKRDLNCGDLVKPEQNLAPGHQNWRKIVEEIDRR